MVANEAKSSRLSMDKCSRFRWIEVETEGENEALLVGGCTATLIGHRLFLLNTAERSTTGHILDLNLQEWSQIVAQDFFPKLTQHSATLVEDQVLVIGLKDATASHRAPQRCPGVYAFDPLQFTWKKIATAGYEVGYRSGHTADYVESLDELVVFGGGDDLTLATNDLLSLDLFANCWKKMETKGETPYPRNKHSSCVVGRKLFIFGGKNHRWTMNDLFVIEMGRRQIHWQQVVSHGRPPGMRYGAALCGIGGGRLVLYGGMPSLSHTDLYLFDGIDSDTAEWNRVTMTQGTFSCTGDKPPFREGAQLVSIGNKILLVGGEAQDSKLYYELVPDATSIDD